MTSYAEKVPFIAVGRFDALEIIMYSLVNGVHGGTVCLPVAVVCGRSPGMFAVDSPEQERFSKRRRHETV